MDGMPRALATWALLVGALAGTTWAVPAGQPSARDAALTLPSGC